MADERDDQSDSEKETDQQTGGQQSHRSEYGDQGQQTMENQGAEGSFGGQSSGSQSGSADANGSTIAGGANDDGGGMSGQPIGGNDSNTGSGTTLTSGYTPPRADSGEGFIGSQGSGSDDYLQNRGTDEDGGEGNSDESSGGSS